MNEIILLKLGELVLKGLNRRTFEDRLVANARRRLQAHGKFKVYTKQSTMYVEPQSEDCDLDGAWEAMTKLFGVVGLSRARACAKDKDAMLQTAVEYLGDRLAAAKTFKVESKRADKTFPMTSIQLSQYVGGELDEKYPNLTVDVHHPELTVYLEVRDYAAYVHADPEPGAGGLPVGVGGRAVSLLSGGIDSPVASYMMAKRGVQLEMIHFASPPYTSEQAREKVLQLARELVPWCGRLTVHVVPFAEIQEEIRRSCPEDHFTLIMRRFMMRLADALAQLYACLTLRAVVRIGQLEVRDIAHIEDCIYRITFDLRYSTEDNGDTLHDSAVRLDATDALHDRMTRHCTCKNNQNVLVLQHRNDVLTDNHLTGGIELRSDDVAGLVHVGGVESHLGELLCNVSADYLTSVHADDRIDRLLCSESLRVLKNLITDSERLGKTNTVYILLDHCLCNSLCLRLTHLQRRHINIIIDMETVGRKMTFCHTQSNLRVVLCLNFSSLSHHKKDPPLK